MSKTSTFGFSDFTWPSAAGPATAVSAELDPPVTAGGPGVQQVFADDLGTLAALLAAARGDGSTWIRGTDRTTGLPTTYVAIGTTFLSLGLYLDDAAPTIMTDGASDEARLGFIYLTVSRQVASGSSSADPITLVTQAMSSQVTYRGGPLPAFSAGEGLQDLAAFLVRKATSFVGSVFELAWESATTGDLGVAGRAAADAVTRAAADASGPSVISGPGGLQVDTEMIMTTGEALALGLGIVAVLALFSLTLLAKQQTAYVRIYNLCPAELDIGLAWLHPDNAYTGPVGTHLITVPGTGPVWTPPWIIGKQAISYTGWVLGNTDGLSRVAAVFRIGPDDAQPGADIMIDIPVAGDNSMAAVIGASDFTEQFWEQQRGQSSGLTLTSPEATAPYRIRMATNQLSGRSPSPVTGALGYHYEFVVVIEPVG